MNWSIALSALLLIPTMAFSQPSEGNDPVADSAMRAQTNCLISQAKSLDDHTSDASTITSGVMAACINEIGAAKNQIIKNMPMSGSAVEYSAQLDKTLRETVTMLVLEMRRDAKLKAQH